MKKTAATPRRRDEATRFRLALMSLRKDQKWIQATLAAKLEVSKKTLSNWEQGYWLPPFKQRLHVVLSLRDAPPEYVLEIADALGVSVDPAVAPLLQPYRDALDGPSTDDAQVPPPAPVPPPEPPRPRPTPEQLRSAVDAVVRDAADSLNARPNEVRAAVGKVLAACAALGGTLEEAQAAAAPRAVATGKP